MSEICGRCQQVIVATCEDDEICPIQIKDICVANTVIDAELGINAEMSANDVILTLITEIKNLNERINRL